MCRSTLESYSVKASARRSLRCGLVAYLRRMAAASFTLEAWQAVVPSFCLLFLNDSVHPVVEEAGRAIQK